MNDLRIPLSVSNLSMLSYDDIEHESGVLFLTYSSLTSKNKNGQRRLDQVIKWLEGSLFNGLVRTFKYIKKRLPHILLTIYFMLRIL